MESLSCALGPCTGIRGSLLLGIHFHYPLPSYGWMNDMQLPLAELLVESVMKLSWPSLASGEPVTTCAWCVSHGLWTRPWVGIQSDLTDGVAQTLFYKFNITEHQLCPRHQVQTLGEPTSAVHVSVFSSQGEGNKGSVLCFPRHLNKVWHIVGPQNVS